MTAFIRLFTLAVPLLSCLSGLMADESLPRILILGDSTYQQAARDVAGDLKGLATVTFVNTAQLGVTDTGRALEKWDELLGDADWDVVHFNFGLGDLVHRAPGLKSFRAMSRRSGGVRTTSPEDYRRNLRAIVKRLQTTGARLIWASTTPIRSSRTDVFEPGSEVRYNEIAASVMTDSKIAITDMHAHVSELINMERPASADPFTFDRKPIHGPVTTRIQRELKSLAEGQSGSSEAVP